jgi:hypothetical protein
MDSLIVKSGGHLSSCQGLCPENYFGADLTAPMTQSLWAFLNYLLVDALYQDRLKPRLVTIIRSCAFALLLAVNLVVANTKVFGWTYSFSRLCQMHQ